MVTCRAYTATAKEDWDHFVETCKTPLFFFKRTYLEYHQDRFTDASLLFYVDEVLVAVFPATKHDKVLNSHGGLTYGGLLLSPKVHAATVLEMMQALGIHAREQGFSKIIYKAVPYLFYQMGAQEDLYALVNQLGARLYRRDLSSVIYLNNRLKLSKGRKWLVARAKKHGLIVSESTDWASFHRLLSEVLARHNTSPVHSPAELAYLFSSFPNNIRLKVIEQDGHLLAAALLFQFPFTTHTQYIATCDEGKELGALDFLVESCIEESRENGAHYFSFGISTEENGKLLNAGLIAQKENFGARGMTIDFYEIDLND